jgi:hypothetical protein
MKFIFVIRVSINSKTVEFPENPKVSMPVEGFSNSIATKHTRNNHQFHSDMTRLKPSIREGTPHG